MKKILKAIWDEFIYGGHLLALGPAIIVWSSARLLDFKANPITIIGAYFLTYAVYSFDRLIGMSEETSILRKNQYERNKLWKLIFIIIAILLMNYCFWFDLRSVIFSDILVFLGLLYGLFFKQITKYILGFKSLFVALLFSASTFFIFFQNNISFWPIFLVFFFFFIRWFVNTSFCDIKDKTQDKVDGLKTLATSLKENSFYNTIILLNFLSIIPIIIGIILHVLPIYSILLSILIPYYFQLIHQVKTQKANLQKISNVWADSEPIIWLITIFLGGTCSELLARYF